MPARMEAVSKRLPKNSKTRRGSRIQPVERSLRLCLKKSHECVLIRVRRVAVRCARRLSHRGGFVGLGWDIRRVLCDHLQEAREQ